MPNSTPRFALALRKFLLSFFVVFTFTAYAIRNNIDNSASNADSAPSAHPQLAQRPDSLVINKSTAVPTSQPLPTISKSTVAGSPTDEDQPVVIPTAIFTDVPPTATFLPAPTTIPLPMPTATAEGQYKDGTYDGPVVDAYYGNVQVEAIIQAGKITDVKFLDYPHDRRTSRFINEQATPWLSQEAVQVQNANVDLISGATFTSQAFVESLQSALAKAQNIS